MQNIRYIIEVVAKATIDNPYFANDVREYYYGKGQHLLSLLGTPNTYLSTEYGYKRKGDATNAAKFWENPDEAKGFWDYNTEVLECVV